MPYIRISPFKDWFDGLSSPNTASMVFLKIEKQRHAIKYRSHCYGESALYSIIIELYLQFDEILRKKMAFKLKWFEFDMTSRGWKQTYNIIIDSVWALYRLQYNFHLEVKKIEIQFHLNHSNRLTVFSYWIVEFE